MLTRNGSPLDNGVGPVRWIALYRGGSAFLFAGASKSARDGKPEADGLIRSVAETMRDLRPRSFRWPSRTGSRSCARPTRRDWQTTPQAIPAEKYHKEELELHQRGVSEQEARRSGEYIKVVE